jgi:pimeloyl-ACP methyl ester carboxylesterase
MNKIWQTFIIAIFLFAMAGITEAQDQAEAPVDPVSLPDQVHPAWDTFEPTFTRYVCPFHAQAPAYDPDEFICGYVLVPEDRTDPDSRLIKLSVLKIVSTSDNPERRAVVRLTGGPGGPSLSAGRIRAYQGPNTKGFRDAADLIFFDQRGIGYSEAHFCRAVPRNFQFGVPIEDGVERTKNAFKTCLDDARKEGIAVDGYTTWQNAMDVRDIRKALGYDQWTLFGVSYGTSLGQAVIQVDEAGVRAAILDSVVPAVPLETGGWGAIAYGFRSALDGLSTDCAANRSCARDIGNFADRFIAAFQAYDDDPLIIEDLDPGSVLEGRLAMDGDLAAGAVFQALYIKSLFADFPSLLKALEDRDETALRAYVEVLGRPIDHSAGNGMELVANCSGAVSVSEAQYAAMRAAEPELSKWTDTLEWDEVCEAVYRIQPDPAVQRLVTDVPILVAAGTIDPITPPNYSQSIMSDLANGQYVEFPYTGHGALFSNSPGCGQEIWLAFVKDPMAPVDTACIANMDAPDFLTRLIETKGPYGFARDLQSRNYPHGVIALAVGLLMTLLMFPLGWAARKIQGTAPVSFDGARPLAWLGALVSLAGLGWAIQQILGTATNHAMALPIGVIPSTGWAFWICLIGFGVTGYALYRGFKSPGFGRVQIGTTLALIITCLASFGLLAFVLSLGLGPF